MAGIPQVGSCSEESEFLGAALEGLDTDECSVGNKHKFKVSVTELSPHWGHEGVVG